MNVTEVRRRLLSLVDDLPREGIVITKRGRAVAEIRPLLQSRTGNFVTGPMIPARGRRGPLAPKTGNPYELVFD